MKKYYYLIFALLTLLPCTSGFSQDARIKSEISPSRNGNGSRFAVEATVMEDDSWCMVSWPYMAYHEELAYDDGEADDIFIFSDPVDGLAPGLYVVRIDMGDELIMRKVIIW